MLILCVGLCPHHSDTRSCTSKDRCRISCQFCKNTWQKNSVFNDSLWSWKGICHSWFQLVIGSGRDLAPSLGDAKKFSRSKISEQRFFRKKFPFSRPKFLMTFRV